MPCLKQVLADSTESEQQKTLARKILTPASEGAGLGDGGGRGDWSGNQPGQNPGLTVSEGSSTAGIVIAVLALIAARR